MEYRIGTHYANGKKFNLTSSTTAKEIKAFLKANPEFKPAILIDDNTSKESIDSSKAKIEPGQAGNSDSSNDNS